MLDSFILFIKNIILWPPVFYLLIAPGLVTILISLLLLIWAERKIAGRIQMRYGPLEISPKIGGAIQLVADLTRYMLQEIIIPRTVDTLPYLIAPIAGFIISLLPVAAIPISPIYFPSPMTNSIIVALALTTLPPILNILAAWASNNKFSLIGGARESFLIAAYELIVILSAIGAMVIYGTSDFTEAVSLQKNLWGIILNPISAIAFYVAVLMATGRFPFEIAEAEAEIVMGAYTEYSGLLYGLSMGISYTRMFVYNVIFSLLFLGGWQPFFTIGGHIFISYVLIPATVVILKALIVSLTMVFTRAIYGRLRIDQALGGAWKFWFLVAIVGLIWGSALTYLQQVI
ncbi:MAG: NADH-quinone oxidoreductase subunit NuoH [Fervidicoccaceae archaeon]|uniref:NADH-quinone oxidoreductase subunit NuoH n=1 Tax=Fervidicoccus fontis TaxID=683846 RepID=A0A7C2UJ83_9CREN|nr:MAG: NADH-quinone oxidoreductase subunit NuoH [Fervidicoccus sp.]HEU97628.1 NADH-quinone oxidoreductase subunit NuoH [Fervidicoccus fontis]